jgi:hypothetical protein
MSISTPPSVNEDEAAVAAVEQHHAVMATALAHLVDAVVDAASEGDASRARAAAVDLATWCQEELVPHALAEEGSMYLPALESVEGRLLVTGMLAEHRRIVGLVSELEPDRDPVRNAATARALQVMFESHLAKENDLVLPLLVADPAVSVASLLGGMHELLGA